ncbi:MAG: AmmeMemoRadiSam system protein A, partial [Stackebrandtia sp.]
MSTPVSGHDTIVSVDEHTAFAEAVPLVAAEAVRHALAGEAPGAAAITARIAAGDARLTADLHREGASFVTLQRDGKLRGCIGSLLAHRPLDEDVVRNALRAMEDPRMAPVDRREWPDLSISVSVLTPPVRLDVGDRTSLLSALRPGVDGLTLRRRARRATFLPSVWESLKNPEDFLAALLRKGGWPPEAWPAGMTAEV